ncbi:MAG: hypothetical protein AAFN94_08710 [Pseudomonadota bacterium]
MGQRLGRFGLGKGRKHHVDGCDARLCKHLVQLGRDHRAIPLQHLLEQMLLTAKGVEQSADTDACCIFEHAGRGRLVAVPPERLHRRIQHFVFVEIAGSRHFTSSVAK